MSTATPIRHLRSKKARFL